MNIMLIKIMDDLHSKFVVKVIGELICDTSWGQLLY